MQCSTKIGAPESHAADCIAVGVWDGGRLTAAAERIDRARRGALRAAVASGAARCRRAELLVLRALAGVAAARVALVGLGKPDEFGDRAHAEVVRTLVKGVGAGVTTLAIADGDWALRGRDARARARAVVVAAREASFRSDELKSRRPDAGADFGPRRLQLLLERRDAGVERGLAEGAAIAGGVELARRLGNLPGNVCTPRFLATEARKLGRATGITVQVLDEARIAALGMNSFLSVARGSDEPPRLIVLKYQGRGRGFGEPIALVGKGITFDSGGISIKPAATMDEMKYDMCGAASVLGTMQAAAALRLRLNLLGVIPACENLPSGRANKPGDVVTAMDGQTIEVLNTDAEGRLILCDALAYARGFKPAAVVDIATLTGACVVALGGVHSGLFSPDEELAAELLAAGREAADTAWRMPLDEEYQEQLKSNFADIPNIGTPGAGAVVAACFLARFTRGMRWAHLDIAGTAWKGGAAKGATGRPVALLTQFLLGQAA